MTNGEAIINSFGCFNYAFHRAELLQLLYENLGKESQDRIHVNKRLSAIQDTGDGVVVTCQDGSQFEGSIVLGADGVHSRTRGIMRQQALDADPNADVNPEVPYHIEYKTMWCSFPRRYEFAPGDHCLTQYVLSFLLSLWASTN